MNWFGQPIHGVPARYTFDRTKVDMGGLMFSNSGHTTVDKFFLHDQQDVNEFINCTGEPFVIIVTEMAVGKMEL